MKNRIDIISRDKAVRMINSGFPDHAAVISFYDPRGSRSFRAESEPVDYSRVCRRVFSLAVYDIDPEILEDYGLTYETYLPEADALAAFIAAAVDDGCHIICQCEYGQSRSGLCHFLPSHGTASVFGLAFGQFGNHHVHAPCFVPDHFINPVHKATPLFLNSPVFSFSCIFWWVSHARFGLPVTFSLPKSLKFPIIPWYTLLNFRSILLYKNVRPYIQYDLLHSSVFLNRSHFSSLEFYTGIQCFTLGRKPRVRNFFLFVLLKHIMDFKTFFSKITKGSFFVLKIFF